jgi:hypothetical protein
MRLQLDIKDVTSPSLNILIGPGREVREYEWDIFLTVEIVQNLFPHPLSKISINPVLCARA